MKIVIKLDGTIFDVSLDDRASNLQTLIKETDHGKLDM
jgi:hypothetical protein